MGFGEAISSCFGKYAGFSGRAPRSEYWYFILFYVLVLIVATVIDAVVIGYPLVQGIASIAMLLPTLAVGARRLHDLDRTGWWLLLAFVPIANILLLVWFCMKGTTGANQYGPDPIPGG